MRTILAAAILSFPALGAYAQEPVRAIPAEAVLVKGDGTFQDIWIIAGTATQIRFLETKVATESKDMNLSAAASLYLKEPIEFTKAMDLFKGRQYAEARAHFTRIAAQFKQMEKTPGNFSTRAGFYEMECLRKAGDLAGLSKAMDRFIAEPLQRGYEKQQVEIYPLWDAVRAKSWERVDALAKELEAKPYPGNLRAQIAYCHGLALEALQRTRAALNAYNTAIIADSGASEEIVKPAAINIMRMIMADESVQVAIKRWGAEDESKVAAGRLLLLEGSTMAHFYKKYIDSNLPVQYQPLVRFKEEEDKNSPVAAADSKEEKDDAKEEKKDSKEEKKDDKKETKKDSKKSK